MGCVYVCACVGCGAVRGKGLCITIIGAWRLRALVPTRPVWMCVCLCACVPVWGAVRGEGLCVTITCAWRLQLWSQADFVCVCVPVCGAVMGEGLCMGVFDHVRFRGARAQGCMGGWMVGRAWLRGCADAWVCGSVVHGCVGVGACVGLWDCVGCMVVRMRA